MFLQPCQEISFSLFSVINFTFLISGPRNQYASSSKRGFVCFLANWELTSYNIVAQFWDVKENVTKTLIVVLHIVLYSKYFPQRKTYLEFLIASCNVCIGTCLPLSPICSNALLEKFKPLSKLDILPLWSYYFLSL